MIDHKTEQDAFYQVMEELKEHHEKYKPALPDELRNIEVSRIESALAEADGNHTYAAKILKIGRTTLLAKMKKYKISS